MLKTLVDLFIGFSRATLLGYGGGPAIVPLYEHEAVDVYRWVTQEEFGQVLAFSNALPGPVATKITMLIGYKVAGWLGAAVALIAVAIPVFIILIGFFAFLEKFKDSPFIKGMVAGIRPVVFVMLAMLAWDFAKYAFVPKDTGPFSWLPFGIAAAYFILVHYLNISPLLGVVASLILGGIFLR
ncbi:chromate transporter [Moorella sp. ACPs]|uniref:chromate transporter n=1 Tax=Neomoorella carbonis TaxID=3062783 RepID=UPI00324CB846